MPYSRNCQSEVKEIQLAVAAMASTLAEMVSKHDPRFKCTLLHIGSVSEGTKVRYPDEFDFTFCLDVMSDASYPEYKEEETMTQIAVALPYSTRNKTISEAFIGIEPEEEVTSIAGYAYLHSSDKIISNLLSEWAGDDDLLSSCQMNYLFSKLLTKVMFVSSFPKDERLIIKEVTIHPEVLLQWRGSRFKDLQISVDIVPAVRLPSWPPTVNKDSILLTKDMLLLPSIAVPKMTSGENEDLWRCSMVLHEIAIFRNMLPKIRNSYIVSKILVHSHVCPQVNFGGNEEMKEYYGHLKGLSEEDLEEIYMYESIESLIPSYLLKMAFFQAVEKRALTNGINSVYYQLTDKSKQMFDTQKCFASSYGPAEAMYHPEHSSDVDIPLVCELFSILENGLLNRFVPSSLNPKQNVLNARLLSGDSEKVHKYISSHFDGNCYYYDGTCIQETRQKDASYDVWILVRPSGEIVSECCSCVHSFSERHKDRYTQACTDVECKWDKPKKKSNPMEADEIDIRRATSTELKTTPMSKNYKPASNIEHRGIEKDMYRVLQLTLLKGWCLSLDNYKLK
ncbi:unnamed protein product [Mytilus coruscus]|uniref:Mab-21-like nucleotidyltransferase domain-containing protein n=1 Tax=Mytilus coruscus TaxID=42192 RepID=A0A6J8AJK4_MYTCO|nr:unnamed protein product [Mytilus coruscus]